MMRRDDIEEEMKNLASAFLYWFSRFEFALKKNGKVRSGPRGAAQADWKTFIKDCEEEYRLCVDAQGLLENPPDVQKLTGGNTWEWAPLAFDEGQSELSKVVLAVKTVRNNLFHGGKHSAAGWDNPDRVRFLLSHGIKVLDSLARLAGYEADYKRRY